MQCASNNPVDPRAKERHQISQLFGVQGDSRNTGYRAKALEVRSVVMIMVNVVVACIKRIILERAENVCGFDRISDINSVKSYKGLNDSVYVILFLFLPLRSCTWYESRQNGGCLAYIA